MRWIQVNGLRLNPDKTEVLRVGGPNIGGLGNSLSFGRVTLTAKREVRSLGVHLDPALTMETQVAPFCLFPSVASLSVLSCVPILMLGHSPLWSMRL